MSDWTEEEIARLGRERLDAHYKAVEEGLGKAAHVFDIVGFLRHIYELGYFHPQELPQGLQSALMALHPAK